MQSTLEQITEQFSAKKVAVLLLFYLILIIFDIYPMLQSANAEDSLDSDVIDVYDTNTSLDVIRKYTEHIKAKAINNDAHICPGKIIINHFEKMDGICFWRKLNQKNKKDVEYGICEHNIFRKNTTLQRILSINSCEVDVGGMSWDEYKIPHIVFSLRFPIDYVVGHFRLKYQVECSQSPDVIYCLRNMNSKIGAKCKNSKRNLLCVFTHFQVHEDRAWGIKTNIFYKIQKDNNVNVSGHLHIDGF